VHEGDPGLAANWPAWQSIHEGDRTVEYLPAGQGEQLVAPTPEVLPAAQLAHTLSPQVIVHEPAGQAVQGG